MELGAKIKKFGGEEDLCGGGRGQRESVPTDLLRSWEGEGLDLEFGGRGKDLYLASHSTD